jgi:multidrug efflux system membrane fusion protein
MQFRSLAIPAISLGAALLALAAGCNRSTQAGAGQMPPPMVTTAPVSVADVPEYIDEIGHTSASESVNIVSQVSGKIIDISFHDGADLKSKQKLFQIDPRPFQAQVDAANAALQQTQAQLGNAQTDFNRVASLLPSKAVAQQDYDNAKNAVAVAQANVKVSEANIETAQLNLEYCAITAPIDGLAGQRLVDAGNVVTANTTTLLTIQKLTPIYVDFTVAENQLDRVRQNMAQGPLKVFLQAPTDAGKTVEGEVNFLDNTVQDGAGTIKLRATVANQERELWPGQFVHVHLILRVLKDAMMVPSEAVQVGQQGQFVYVVQTDPATKRSSAQQQIITTGQKQGDMVVVEKGLQPGQMVIRSGQLMPMLFPGIPVMIAPDQPAAQPAGAKP